VGMLTLIGDYEKRVLDNLELNKNLLEIISIN